MIYLRVCWEPKRKNYLELFIALLAVQSSCLRSGHWEGFVKEKSRETSASTFQSTAGNRFKPPCLCMTPQQDRRSHSSEGNIDAEWKNSHLQFPLPDWYFLNYLNWILSSCRAVYYSNITSSIKWMVQNTYISIQFHVPMWVEKQQIREEQLNSILLLSN